jgi:hypothetical protein
MRKLSARMGCQAGRRGTDFKNSGNEFELMPAISLVVCLYQQRELLERLLRESAGCYDDLVVVHDGPDTANVRTVAETAGGRFFERPHEFQQEPHWPFAWGQAKHDWILRLDADEFPSEEMKTWLREFRSAPEPPDEISGYTCIWPLWNKDHAVTKRWPQGREFLFNRQRVRFFGMVEQTPIPDVRYEPLDFILHHQPPGRTVFGVRNIILRKQAYHWRECIARSLLGKPTDLACWRWEDETWPLGWEQIRQRPLWTAFKRLVKGTLCGLRDQWLTERRFFPFAAIGGPLHHTLICFEFRRLQRAKNRNRQVN